MATRAQPLLVEFAGAAVLGDDEPTERNHLLELVRVLLGGHLPS
jgi:hypothetical protein